MKSSQINIAKGSNYDRRQYTRQSRNWLTYCQAKVQQTSRCAADTSEMIKEQRLITNVVSLMLDDGCRALLAYLLWQRQLHEPH